VSFLVQFHRYSPHLFTHLTNLYVDHPNIREIPSL